MSQFEQNRPSVDAAFDPERRQAEAEWNAYLDSRPVQDEQGNLFSPDGQPIESASDYFDQQRDRRYEDEQDQDYSEMSPVRLARIVGEAYFHGDQTTLDNAEEALNNKTQEMGDKYMSTRDEAHNSDRRSNIIKRFQAVADKAYADLEAKHKTEAGEADPEAGAEDLPVTDGTTEATDQPVEGLTVDVPNDQEAVEPQVEQVSQDDIENNSDSEADRAEAERQARLAELLGGQAALSAHPGNGLAFKMVLGANSKSGFVHPANVEKALKLSRRELNDPARAEELKSLTEALYGALVATGAISSEGQKTKDGQRSAEEQASLDALTWLSEADDPRKYLTGDKAVRFFMADEKASKLPRLFTNSKNRARARLANQQRANKARLFGQILNAVSSEGFTKYQIAEAAQSSRANSKLGLKSDMLIKLIDWADLLSGRQGRELGSPMQVAPTRESSASTAKPEVSPQGAVTPAAELSGQQRVQKNIENHFRTAPFASITDRQLMYNYGLDKQGAEEFINHLIDEGYATSQARRDGILANLTKEGQQVVADRLQELREQATVEQGFDSLKKEIVADLDSEAKDKLIAGFDDLANSLSQRPEMSQDEIMNKLVGRMGLVESMPGATLKEKTTNLFMLLAEAGIITVDESEGGRFKVNSTASGQKPLTEVLGL